MPSPPNPWIKSTGGLTSPRERYQKALERCREPYGPSHFSSARAFGAGLLFLLFFGWVITYGDSRSSSEDSRLPTGMYQLNLNMGTTVGQFSITSLQVDPSNSVRLTGLYRNTIQESVTLECAAGAGGNIKFSDGTSLSATSHTCTGHEGQNFRADPGRTVNQYLVFPSNKGFSPGASVDLVWSGRQWKFSLPSTPSSS